MKLKSYTTFHVEGLNQERFYNRLSNRVEIFEVNRFDKSHSNFKASFKDSKKIQKICMENRMRVLNIENSGFVASLFTGIRRYGVVAALFCICVLYGISHLFVLNVVLTGADGELQNEIYQTLQKIGVEKGTLKSKFKTEEIELKLLKENANLSFVSCIIKGQSLIINVKEKLLPDEHEKVFSPICAKEDGKIERINLISGTLNCKVGDIVRKGAALVYPFILDSSGSKKEVVAKAEITSTCYLVESVVSYDIETLSVKTGKECEDFEITLFGIKIYSKQSGHQYSSFEKHESIEFLSSNNLLPLKVKRIKYMETRSEIINNDFSVLKKEIIKKARQNALLKKQDYEIITHEYSTIRNEVGKNTVTYVLEVLRRIDTYEVNAG